MTASVATIIGNAAAIEFTILIPCLDEAETIGIVVQKAMTYLSANAISGEVLVADNGSTDGSQAMARGLGARVIDVPVRGYGAALIAGIDAARGRYIIMGDADDSYDFTALGLFVEKLRGGSDLVMGNRFKGGIAPGAMPMLHRYLGNPVLSQLGRSFFDIPVGDFHCGLRGFASDFIRSLGLVNQGMEFASEMVVKAAMRGLVITEVPTRLSPDGRSRPPHLRTWRDGWRHLRFLLLHSPRWLFLYPGIAFVIIGLVALAALGGGKLVLGPDFALGIHSLAVACFAVLIGSQLVLFSGVARRYAEIEGILPESTRYHGVLAALTLETIVPLGGIFLVGGLIGFGVAVMRWVESGFGPIVGEATLRIVLISLTSIALGVQTIASGFLASVFAIRHKRLDPTG
jgi:glycosyltransferase involved in cell wall biosynthesis